MTTLIQSDLLTITDYDSDDFIDRIRGSFQLCCSRSESAAKLHRSTMLRIDGMRRHTFNGLTEIGEAFLRVQEARPGEFETWFSIHEHRLEMSLRTAYKCKAHAENARKFGLDRAFEMGVEKASREMPEPTLELHVRLTRDLSELNQQERMDLRKRLAPAVEADLRLAAMEVASAS